MAKGKKTPPETVYTVLASYAVTNDYSETSRLVGVPASTVEKLVKENKDKPEFVELCAEKKTEFAAHATVIIGKALKRLEAAIDDEGTSIPVNQLTTVIGTLYDKRALAQDESTENITFKLPDGVKDYAD